jgi:hypothetical protein
MEEPSAYLKLKIHCPPPNAVPDVQPFHLADKDSIAYDPTSTLVQLVIVDSNDNRPAFPERRMTVGYPVQDVATTVLPRHLVQVKVSVCASIDYCRYYGASATSTRLRNVCTNRST